MVILDTQTYQAVVQGRHSIAEAIEIAGQRGATALWQLNVDDRGRPLGVPFRLPLKAS
jgi:hypothetical protein